MRKTFRITLQDQPIRCICQGQSSLKKYYIMKTVKKWFQKCYIISVLVYALRKSSVLERQNNLSEQDKLNIKHYNRRVTFVCCGRHNGRFSRCE